MKSNGNLIADNKISIDLWNASDSRPRLHFLTHLHADHTVGLTQFWHKPIYTSEINCKLAPLFIKGLCPSLLVPLRLNEETTLDLSGYGSIYLISNICLSLEILKALHLFRSSYTPQIEVP